MNQRLAYLVLFCLHYAALQSQPFSQSIVLLDSTGADIQANLVDVEDIVYLGSKSDSETYIFQFVNNDKHIYKLIDEESIYHNAIPNIGALLIGFYDFNYDSIPDLLGNTQISFGSSGHSYLPPVSVINDNFLGLVRRAGDFDHNGTLDIATLESKFQGGDFIYIIHVYLLFSDRSIMHEFTFQEVDEVLVFQINDFNNDGFLDVLYLLDIFGSNKVVLHKNNQNNTFTRQQINFQNTDNFMEPADFDSDQYSEFVITGSNGRDLHLVQNNVGNLGLVTKIIDTEKLLGLKIGDINSDGKKDIVYVETEDFEIFHIRYILGLDSLQFGSSELIGSIVGSGINVSTYIHAYESWLALRDYDLDGDLDVFMNEIRNGNFLLYKNLFQQTNSISIQDETALQVYPNPTTEGISIVSNKPFSRVEVINNSGAIMMKDIFEYTMQKSISLESFPRGTYFLRLTNNNSNTYTKKIIKH